MSQIVFAGGFLLCTDGRCASAVRRGSAKKSCLFNLKMLDEKKYSNMVERYAKAINSPPPEYAEQILHREK
jgi:hypothetical protein